MESRDDEIFTVEPRKVVFDFLDELPVTIKERICYCVLVYGNGEIRKHDDILVSIRDFLFVKGFPKPISHLLRAIAAIDYEFSRRVTNVETLIKIAEVVPELESAVMRHPLVARHIETSRIKWNALRSENSPLSYQSIQAFEDSNLSV